PPSAFPPGPRRPPAFPRSSFRAAPYGDASMNIVKATSNPAPKFLTYGMEGLGKTTLGSKFPSPVALLLERGLPRGVEIDAFDGNATASFDGVMTALRSLYSNPGEYKTLFVDGLEVLERLIVDHT